MVMTNMGQGDALSVALIGGVIALLLAIVFRHQVLKMEGGTPEMKLVSDAVHEGAKAFLNTEYKWLTVFVVLVGICIVIINPEPGTDGVFAMISFLVGAFLSASAGYAGMIIATQANVRTTQACRTSLLQGLSVAFRSGAVMSLTVVGFGILGLSILLLAFDGEGEKRWAHVAGFGFGASSIALFARVGGGVFTKAADVGADLVGKVEAGIPEDDPRNPATIADNVGDNVGDVAGMGADLFESYVGSLIAAGTLAAQVASEGKLVGETMNFVALPFWIAGFGVIASFIGIMLVINRKLSNTADLETLLWTIRYGILLSGVVVIILSIITCTTMFESDTAWRLFACILTGLVAGNVIGFFTEYCTSYSYRPTISIAESGRTGPATVVIQGLGVGMISVVVPTAAIVASILICDALAGLYGISVAAVGMLSTLGITLATDAYGPVADNAGGIAEMVADCPEEVRDRTDSLDALGNTTAATGKGFAIGSAVLTSVGLIAAFMESSGLGKSAVDLKEPVVLSGVLIGACLPFIFAALTMLSVGKSAQAIIEEVRRQFALAPSLREEGAAYPVTVDGEQLPNYQACVNYCTTAAIQEMLIPGAMAVFAPAVVGSLLGSLGLAGMLAGSLASGFMLALTMANAGGAWDNAKKLVEKDPIYGGKKTAHHAAVVAGDTVGDPFKDTSGPALNILIKLMSVVSLVLAPSFKKLNEPKGFGTVGTSTAIVVFLAVTGCCWLATMIFKRSNANKKAEIEALRARAAAKSAAADAEAGGAPAAETKAEEEEGAEGVTVEVDGDAKPADE